MSVDIVESEIEYAKISISDNGSIDIEVNSTLSVHVKYFIIKQLTQIGQVIREQNLGYTVHGILSGKENKIRLIKTDTEYIEVDINIPKG